MNPTPSAARPGVQCAILEALRTTGPASRTGLVSQLKVGKSTISTAVAQLMAEGLIEELDETSQTTGGGRPARFLRLCADNACIVGLDVGGTKIYAVVTDLAGQVLYEKKVPTTNQLDELERLVWECVDQSGMPRSRVLGLGLGIPGTVNKEGVILRCRALSWENFPLLALLSQRFSFPVAVGNDVNMIAMGEQWLGAGQGASDLLYIAFGTNVGGAVIANGRLVLGHTFRAGEVGYQLGRYDLEQGRFNQAGKAGVFESKTSGTALGQYGMPAQQLFLQYAAHNPAAQPAVKQFITETAVVIANGLSFLNPQKVVLGGGVAGSLAPVLPEIKALVEQITPIRTEICLSQLGERAGALGAVSLVLQSNQLASLL